MSNYRPADTLSQWFQDDYPGADLNLTPDTMVVVLHTTEGFDWPGYEGGATAPNYTHKPSFHGGAGLWRAHFPDEKSSRALRNEAGGVETNTLNCVQVELIGTCDSSKRKRWGDKVAGRDYVYWPDATDDQLAEVAEFLADMNKRHGLKLVAPKQFISYPLSAGNSRVRMSMSEWRNAAGVVGHQHVPENTHGDPGDIDIDKIFTMTQPKPARQSSVLHVMHASMEFSDTPAQHELDLTRIFARAEGRKVAWITGTEVSAKGFVEQLETIATRHGYRVGREHGNDSWVAVREDMIDGGWSVDYQKVLDGVKGEYGDKGVLGVGFDNVELGHITVIAMHLLTKGRPGAKDPAMRVHVKENAQLLKAVGVYAEEQARGTALVFYGGDQNIVDRTGDTFLGEPFTSTWDELQKWENTGNGNIDVIASYDADGRVTASYARAFDDTEFPLDTDHYLTEAGFTVRHLT
jgi:hypothetical protein